MSEKKGSHQLIITPETKIGTLLDTFPELEKLLIEMAPAFSKLRNPILRKTIAKVANLRQAAEIGNIPLGEMINQLRCAVGQETMGDVSEKKGSVSDGIPEWVSGHHVIETLDARPMLAKGEHPMDLVIAKISELRTGEIYGLITPFKPVPLIETAQKKGIQTWTQKKSDQEFFTYFRLNKNSH